MQIIMFHGEDQGLRDECSQGHKVHLLKEKLIWINERNWSMQRPDHLGAP